MTLYPNFGIIVNERFIMKIWESDRAMEKMLKRYLRGECVSCGKKPCKCKTKGKIRNRKSLGKNESYEPSLSSIAIIAKQIQEDKLKF